MASVHSLYLATFDILYGTVLGEHPAEDTLASTVSGTGDTSWTWDTPAMWKRGNYAEAADTTGELVYIAVDNGTTVRRGQRGTTAAASYSAGDVFYRNPKFPHYLIDDMVRQVVDNDLWPHVWTWHQDSLSYTTGQTVYDLDEYVEDVVRVSQYDLNGSGKWYPIENRYWDTERQVASAVSTNSNMLRLRWVHDEDATVYYTAKRRPDTGDLGNVSDEIADIVPWAAAAKVIAARGVSKRQRPIVDDAQQTEGGEFRDYRSLMAEFLRMRDQLRRKLMDEVPAAPRFRPRNRRKAF